jgi:Ca2+-binding RTX toxin-like protein
MTTEIDSDRNGPDIQLFSDSADDDYIIKQGVTVYSTGSIGTWLKNVGHDLTVNGTAQAKLYGVILGDTASEAANNKLTVGLLGEVQGGDIATVVWGSGTVENNGGDIIAGGIGIRFNQSGTTASKVINSGLIEGGNLGIQTSASGQATTDIYNFGTIRGGTYAITDTGGGDNHVMNRGFLDGIVSLYSGDDLFDNIGGELTNEVFMGNGDDVVRAGTHAETYFGGVGLDHLDFSSSTTGLRVSLVDMSGTGRAKGDRYWEFENVTGSQTGADTILGGKEANTFWGQGGNDTLRGGLGEDLLLGATGGDKLYGGGDNDSILGGTGADVLHGGAGKDMLIGGVDRAADDFVFSTATDSGLGIYRDVVAQFERGIDDIVLREIDAKAGTAINEAFAWAGKSAAAHSVWWSATSQGVVLRGDVDGNKYADFEILLKGLTGFGQGDVIL